MSKSPYKKVKLQVAPNIGGHAYDYPSMLRQRCSRFQYTKLPYQVEGDDTLYYKAYKRFKLTGGTANSTINKFDEMVSFMQTWADDTVRVEVEHGGGYYTNTKSELVIHYWCPFSEKDLATFEADKARVQALCYEVATIKAKRAEKAKAERKASEERQRKFNAALKADQKSAEKDNELIEIGKASAVLRKAGVDVTVKAK
jgi:hypothetical protein